jgi:hypothetical protein
MSFLDALEQRISERLKESDDDPKDKDNVKDLHALLQACHKVIQQRSPLEKGDKIAEATRNLASLLKLRLDSNDAKEAFELHPDTIEEHLVSDARDRKKLFIYFIKRVRQGGFNQHTVICEAKGDGVDVVRTKASATTMEEARKQAAQKMRTLLFD